MKPELFSVPDVMFNSGMSVLYCSDSRHSCLVLCCVFVNQWLHIDELENAID